MLDFFLKREGVDHARRILSMGYEKSCILCVSSLTFSHIAYIMRKVAKGDALYDILDTLTEMVNIIAVDDEVIVNAIYLRADDFEDAIQYYSAKKMNVTCIVTNNIKDFVYSDIEVFRPSEFLDSRNPL